MMVNAKAKDVVWSTKEDRLRNSVWPEKVKNFQEKMNSQFKKWLVDKTYKKKVKRMGAR